MIYDTKCVDCKKYEECLQCEKYPNKIPDNIIRNEKECEFFTRIKTK